jgi:hypothetical protein
MSIVLMLKDVHCVDMDDQGTHLIKMVQRWEHPKKLSFSITKEYTLLQHATSSLQDRMTMLSPLSIVSLIRQLLHTFCDRHLLHFHCSRVIFPYGKQKENTYYSVRVLKLMIVLH